MANAKFRVALSGDFRKPDGSPTYPDFDLGPLRNAPGVDVAFLESNSPLLAEQLEDIDALILLVHRFDSASVPRSGLLAVSATTPLTSRRARMPGSPWSSRPTACDGPSPCPSSPSCWR